MKKRHPGKYPGKPYPERGICSFKNRFQRNIQKTTNQFMPFWKRVHDAPPSGVTTEEEIIKVACDAYHEFYEKRFPFVKCLEVLQKMSKFNLLDYKDPDEETVINLVEQNLAAEEKDGDKKPAAINKIAAVMRAGLARPIGSKKSKKMAQRG